MQVLFMIFPHIFFHEQATFKKQHHNGSIGSHVEFFGRHMFVAAIVVYTAAYTSTWS
jgi:hypothetical protein